MDLYTKTSYELSELLTKRYSTSFSLSTQLFPREIRKAIFAIYGLVRIADEIVDSYQGNDAKQQLDELERELDKAITTNYSANPLVHAFAQTAQLCTIDPSLTRPFFDSMRMDLAPIVYTKPHYDRYIHGSAEVIGLMCLKVFCQGNMKLYEELSNGAKALGAAYQKVNFLRDIAIDHKRGRMYFPGLQFTTFGDQQKHDIVLDIEHDFTVAQAAISNLPHSAKKAVTLSFYYYNDLLERLKKSSAEQLKTARIRVPDSKKMLLFAAVISGAKQL